MNRTPNDDRSDAGKPGAPRQVPEDRSRANDPLQQQPAARRRQQQSANDREFAPGEDGECH